ncbi:tellurite resistance TerB family protein [Pseudonocardia sp. TRM90224]|uniref:tellurite resistance TerB family protein n=1 Tax=Pseudonocardia sp. TRM90224 TaxID=2812678 RepID=UPI001E64396B|nr:tellurite resistance TerB family protein [Pseudonocardia sp. TRM90224]
MTTQTKTQVSKFQNKEFANASMAMCALIAAADGSIDASERAKTAAFIGSNDVLSVFQPAMLQERFEWYASKLESNFDFGKLEAIATIGKLKSKPDAGRAVINVGIIIGGADGDFDKNEQQAVREACNALGIPPAEFDL